MVRLLKISALTALLMVGCGWVEATYFISSSDDKGNLIKTVTVSKITVGVDNSVSLLVEYNNGKSTEKN
jgi:hypothetical protein